MDRKILTLTGMIFLAMTATACQKAKMKSVPAAVVTPATDNPGSNPGPTPNTPTGGQGPVNPYNPPVIEIDHETHWEPPVLPPTDFEPPAHCTTDCDPVIVRLPDVPKDEDLRCGEGGHECPVIVDREYCQELPIKKKQNKADILIVADTSKSMMGGKTGGDGELAAIADAVGSLLSHMPDDTDDYRIAVMLGNGPGNKHHAKLLKISGDDKAVIDVKRLIRNNGGDKDKAYKQVRSILKAKLLALKNRKEYADLTRAQGEALLLSVYDSMKSKAAREVLKGQGFLRDDAMLGVIFVADEQDVCYDYSSEKNADNTNKYSPALAEGKVDQAETDAFNGVCAKAGPNGERLTPEHVKAALVRAKGGDEGKVLATGILYLNNDLPQGLEDENEMGHGYLGLIALTHSVPMNLANVDRGGDQMDFAPLMTEIGEMAYDQMRYEDTFACSSNVDPYDVNQSSMQVEIFDGSNSKAIATFSSQCTDSKHCPPGIIGPVSGEIVKGGQGGRFLNVSITNQKQLRAVLRNRNLSDSAVVKVSFYPLKDSKGNPVVLPPAEDYH